MPAIAGLAALDALVVSLVALIFLYATYQLWGPLLQAALSRIPFGVGSWLDAQAMNLLAAIWSHVAGWSEAGVGAVVAFLDNIALIPLFSVQRTAETLEAITAALVRLGFTWLPAFAKQMTDYAWLAANRVEIALDYQLGQLQTWTQAGLAQLASWTQQQLGAAMAYLSARLGQLEGWTQATVAALASSTAARLAALEGWTLASLQALEATFLAGLATERAWVEGALAALQALVAARFGQAVTYTDQVGASALEQALAHDQALWDVLWPAVAAVGAQVVELEGRPCLQFCDPLGGLGSALQDLGDAALVAALVALVGECVTHPRQVEADLQAVAIGPVSQLAQGLGQLAGITLGCR